MSLGYATVITSIHPKRVDELRNYLREKVQPKFNPDENVDVIKCQPAFPLHDVRGLHFCSMVILRGAEKSDPSCLVFEATFDGPRDEFFDDLLRVAARDIDEIYKHCSDYPVSGSTVRELVKEYLISHDVGANTFYSGSPGRSVAQIRGERDLHEKIARHVCRRRREKDAPTTFLDLQRELQREVIRKEPNHRKQERSYQWAEQPAVTPWEVANRKLIRAAAFIFGILAFLALGALVVYVLDWPGRPLDLFLQGIDDQARFPTYTLPRLLALSICGWSILRFVAFLWEVEDPRQTNFYWRFWTHVLYVLRNALIFFIVLLSLDPRLEWAPVGKAAAAALLLIALVAGYFATSAKLAVQLQALSPGRERVRRFLQEVFRVVVIICAVFAFLILKPHLPTIVTLVLNFFVVTVPFYRIFYYTLVGALTFYGLALLLAMLVRSLELAERARYASATGLLSKPVDPSLCEREEGGVNKYQNHLASLTYVKPGVLRIALLRLTLYAIGQLARFWFNQGELGGIPTILAARWVLIDGGKRLLFLTNYVGGWDSYLDEFIDMGAVLGLNAIWSNTFVKLDDSSPGYAFPATQYCLWEGAQAEKPFKAYVRHSQVETLVWYGAYPTLSIKNINANTDLRQALFKPLAPCELDSVLLRAGL